MSLRLYVWDRVVALEDCAPGLAFALAESKDQAIELILHDRRRERGPDIGVREREWSDAQVREYAPHSLEALKRELTREEPVVYERPVGFAEVGSA